MNLHYLKLRARVLLKWSGILLIVLVYLLVSGLLTVLPLPSRARRSVRIRTTASFSGLALMLFNVKVDTRHRERLSPGARRGRLVISNHVSYIDVLVLSALFPSVFITSVELKNTPLLGVLAVFGGSLFVDRRRPSGLKREVEEITRVLKQGFTVVLFPEGTTSNGDRVQPFKRSLFDAAVSAGVVILPLCIRYRSINEEPVSPENRDSLFYYGGAAFAMHFPRFLALRSVKTEVVPLEAINPQDHASRKEVAAAAQEAISKAYEVRCTEEFENPFCKPEGG